MMASMIFLFSLFFCANAQYMSTWGTGYSNQMQMPIPYTHTPYHHMGSMRDAAIDMPIISYGPSFGSKSDGMPPIQVLRTKMPNRLGPLGEYQMYNVNGPDQDDMSEHLIYKQSIGDVKRPVMGLISILPAQVPSMMNAMGSKIGSGYQDPIVDELMTCVGNDMTEPMKMHTTEPRIIINRAIPWFTTSLQKTKI